MRPTTVSVRLVLPDPDATCTPERLELTIRTAGDDPLDTRVKVSESAADEGTAFTTKFTTATPAFGHTPHATFTMLWEAIQDEYDDTDISAGRLTVKTDTSLITKQFGVD